MPYNLKSITKVCCFDILWFSENLLTFKTLSIVELLKKELLNRTLFYLITPFWCLKYSYFESKYFLSFILDFIFVFCSLFKQNK